MDKFKKMLEHPRKEIKISDLILSCDSRHLANKIKQPTQTKKPRHYSAHLTASNGSIKNFSSV